jgi:hypothetical protein
MARADDAVDSFKKGFSCSQAVFSSFSEELGLHRETALKIAGGPGIYAGQFPGRFLPSA